MGSWLSLNFRKEILSISCSNIFKSMKDNSFEQDALYYLGLHGTEIKQSGFKCPLSPAVPVLNFLSTVCSVELVTGSSSSIHDKSHRYVFCLETANLLFPVSESYTIMLWTFSWSRSCDQKIKVELGNTWWEQEAPTLQGIELRKQLA